MLCQNCEKNEATTHIKRIVNGDMSQTYLCAECAKLLGANEMFSDFGIGLKDFFGSFFGDTLPVLGQSSTVRCPKCGCSFDDIVKSGKVGCAQCYEVFYDKLLPSLQRLHGKINHSGKISVSFGLSAPEPEQSAEPAAPAEESVEEKIAALKEEMALAVSEQEFETAARLRDEIKELEGGSEK